MWEHMKNNKIPIIIIFVLIIIAYCKMESDQEKYDTPFMRASEHSYK